MFFSLWMRHIYSSQAMAELSAIRASLTLKFPTLLSRNQPWVVVLEVKSESRS